MSCFRICRRSSVNSGKPFDHNLTCSLFLLTSQLNYLPTLLQRLFRLDAFLSVHCISVMLVSMDFQFLLQNVQQLLSPLLGVFWRWRHTAVLRERPLVSVEFVFRRHHRTCWRSWFLFRTYRVQIYARKTVILTRFLWFSSVHPDECRDSALITPSQPPSTHFPIHNLRINLSFNVMESELLKASLNELTQIKVRM
jgi:hypothetical protein